MNQWRSHGAHAKADAAPTAADWDFGALYEKAYRLLWVIAAGIASPGEATDIVQQATVKAIAKRDQFQPGTDFTVWMSQFVRYTACNHVRAQRRAPRPLPLEELETMNGAGPNPAAPLRLTDDDELPDNQQAFDDAMVHALNALPATARACLLLRTVQGLSYAEIGRALDLPEGTAMSHVHRSRQALRRMLTNPNAAAAKKQDRQP